MHFSIKNITDDINILEKEYNIYYLWGFPVRIPIHYVINNLKSFNDVRVENSLKREQVCIIKVTVSLLNVIYCEIVIKMQKYFPNNKRYCKIRTSITYIIPDLSIERNNNLCLILVDDIIIKSFDKLILNTIRLLRDRNYGIFFLCNKLVSYENVESLFDVHLKNDHFVLWNRFFVITLLPIKREPLGPVVVGIKDPPENGYLITSSDSILLSNYIEKCNSIHSYSTLIYIPYLNENTVINRLSLDQQCNEYIQLFTSKLCVSTFLDYLNKLLSTLKKPKTIEDINNNLNKIYNGNCKIKNLGIIKTDIFVFEPTEKSINGKEIFDDSYYIERIYKVIMIQRWFISVIQKRYKKIYKRYNNCLKNIELIVSKLDERRSDGELMFEYLIRINKLLNTRRLIHIPPPTINDFNGSFHTWTKNNDDVHEYVKIINNQKDEIKKLRGYVSKLNKKIEYNQKEKVEIKENKPISVVSFESKTEDPIEPRDIYKYTHTFSKERFCQFHFNPIPPQIKPPKKHRHSLRKLRNKNSI